ncbi:MAG TPA: hypothetical protein VK174_11840 [Chitinophagales bacterium]|nr:hypothetical protein [Chitinophagales bacterium]
MKKANSTPVVKFAFFFIFSVIGTGLFAQAETQNPDFPFWKIKGNTGTDTALHFAGTTDANAFTLRTNNIRRVTIDVNGKLGVGTVLPQQLLHLFGNNTIRIGGLATSGTYIAAPTASTDNLLYADANGDLRGIPTGTAGQMLSISGSGVPAWVTPASASNDWTTTGNTGTVDGTNFIGTTDNVSFNIKVNNQKAGRIATTGGNNFYGLLAGNANTGSSITAIGFNVLAVNTGNDNTGVGFNALSANTSGIYNTAMGAYAMLNNTTGNDNTAIGRNALQANTGGGQNTAVGKEALPSNTTGSNNSAFGYQAMLNNSTGNSCVAFGNAALRENTTGIFNCGFGRNALRNNTTGNDNTAIGKDALFTNSTGAANTAIGKDAMLSNTGGNGNIAMGYQALLSNTTGTDNVALGRDAMRTNSTGVYNTAVGKDAMRSNTTGFNNTSVGTFSLSTNSTGENNTAVGMNSLQNNTGSFNTATGSNSLRTNTTGSENVAYGKDALYTNSTGASNCAYGYQALLFNTTSNDNTATGRDAMRTNTTGAGNTASGRSALYSNSTSNYSTAFGYQGLYNNTAAENTAVGSNGLFNNTTGTQNTVIGGSAGFTNISGSQNTYLGYNTRGGATLTNATAVGANAVVSASNSLVLGNNAYVGIGVNSPLYPLHVNGYSGNLSTPANEAWFIPTSTVLSQSSSATTASVSIYASNYIASGEGFVAHSDVRIKRISGISNNAADLQALNQIQVTDYSFIDTIGKGSGTCKKVIAQQIEKIYPQAVHTVTDVVPDIYRASEIKSGYITIPNNLQKGDVVKLILDRGVEMAPVLSANSQGFSVALKDEGRVFVYGKQVNDFRTVDYEAISMLNVSATQELAKKVTHLEEINRLLIQTITEVKNQVKELNQALSQNMASSK